MTHSKTYFQAVAATAQGIDEAAVEALAAALDKVRRDRGRLFVIGVGGSAGNASHAVNDFRKLCGIEAYAPTDNVSELTARTNDEGWQTVFSEWLKVSNVRTGDALLILSVGGGNAERGVSMNLISAIDLAQERGVKVFGLVGRADGYTAQKADRAIIVPTADEKWQTPLTEAFQAVIWHGLVSHPLLQTKETTW